MKAYFVTGTDTGVGKTTVSCALLASASHRGLRSLGMKPAESGCERNAYGELLPQDALRLLRFSSMSVQLDEICLYRLEKPIAPGIAAAEANVPIDLATIRENLHNVRQRDPDLLLVEGAGGLLVPFGPSTLVADLVSELDLPLIVVARPGLGTINHTLLTLEAAASRGLTVAGFAFSHQQPNHDPAFVASNAAAICEHRPIPFLGSLPRIEHETPEVLSRAGQALLDRVLA